MFNNRTRDKWTIICGSYCGLTPILPFRAKALIPLLSERLATESLCQERCGLKKAVLPQVLSADIQWPVAYKDTGLGPFASVNWKKQTKKKRNIPACLVTLDSDPIGCSLPECWSGKILEWVAISSSRGSSQPGVEPASPASPALQVDSLPLSHQEACTMW